MKKVIPIIIIIALAVIIGKKIKEKKLHLKNMPAPKIPTYTVKGFKIKQGEIKLKKDFIGKILPDKSVNISSKLSGFIEKVYVSENDVVKKEDLLVKIDDREIKFQIKNLNDLKDSLISQIDSLKAQLEGAKAKLEYLKNKFKRDKKLYLGKAISKESFEFSRSNYFSQKALVQSIKSSIKSVKSKIKSTIAQIGALQDRLKYTEIYSNIDGIVTKVFLHEGNLATPGKPILNIQTTNNYKILVEVPLKFSSKLNKNTKVLIDFSEKKVISHINKIYPKSNEHSLSIVEIRVPEIPENVTTNSWANVSFFYKRVKGLIVPVDSILTMTNGKNYILTLKNKKFVKIPVRIIAENDKFAVIKGNIAQGMSVAVAMQRKLRLLSLGAKGSIMLQGAN